MQDVMIDMETLGTVASSVIMSIGAVRFNLESGEIEEDGFYASVSIDSNLELGRQISESTIIWWMSQSDAARKVFTEPKQPLNAALESFAEWFSECKDPSRTRVWANGASFDLPMLTHAYYLHGQTQPWQFYNERCVRTYKNLPAAERVAKPSAGVAHNALADAYNQAVHVCAIHKAMTARVARVTL